MRDFGWQKRTGIPIWLMAPEAEGLWYQVELWNLTRTKIERILARAADGAIAQQMFEAACREHAGRYITLSYGPHVVDRSE